MTMEAPPWAVGLHRCGLYYEGVVDDLEKTLELHKKVTVTTYGTRTSRCSKPLSTKELNEENQGVAEDSDLQKSKENEVRWLQFTRNNWPVNELTF